MKLVILLFFILLDLLYEKDSSRFTVRDHRNLLNSRGGEMEMAKPGLEEETRMKVVLEVDEVGEEELMVMCEGQCDVDKWRSTYVRHWRRKAKSMNQKIV